jgi:hypothetical protein
VPRHDHEEAAALVRAEAAYADASQRLVQTAAKPPKPGRAHELQVETCA